MKKKLFWTLFLLPLILSMFSCGSHYTPKPVGYFRIDLPPHAYRPFDSTFPYSFSRSVYTRLSDDPHSPHQKYWLDIHYPRYKATIHISYRRIDHNLRKYLEDTRKMVIKHIPKANAINDSLIVDPKRDIYGMTYDIEGSGVASPYQFFLTDSVRNFLRGSLYFYVQPNNDSLAPVIRYIKDDIRRLIKTFHWKKPAFKTPK